MHPIVRIVGIGIVFVIACAGWITLGGVMTERTHRKTYELDGNVVDLWGSPQVQNAPTFTFEWGEQRIQTRMEVRDGLWQEVEEVAEERHSKAVQTSSSDITVDLALDQRLKGLMWFPLYDVDFAGAWAYTHREEVAGDLTVSLSFPTADGLYDAFRFEVDGVDLAGELRPEAGAVAATVPVQPGQTVTLDVGYASRGKDIWRYVPAPDVANLEDFRLTMTTDFARIDFPSYTMSPSSKHYTDEGWTLTWDFSRIVTGHDIGMVMPVPIQPGALAAKLAFSAPISLMFFFLLLFVLSVMRGIEIHPINYLFLGAAFFAFHLLFSYSVDHIHLATAFALSSAVSILLVVSYLRLVVSPRFAFVEAGAAQMVYLIGFSLAHFWDGFTGLTVTVLSILTLFILMQMTGRIRWSEVMGRAVARQPSEAESAAGAPAGSSAG